MKTNRIVAYEHHAAGKAVEAPRLSRAERKAAGILERFAQQRRASTPYAVRIDLADPTRRPQRMPLPGAVAVAGTVLIDPQGRPGITAAATPKRVARGLDDARMRVALALQTGGKL